MAPAVDAMSVEDSVVSVIGQNSFEMWSGSGFVVGDGTYAVTCFHVAARKLTNDRPVVPARLTVVSPWTGDSVEARVVRMNSEADLALLRLDGPPLPALPLGPEDALDPETLGEQPPRRVRLHGFPHLATVADPAVSVRVASADTDLVRVIPSERLPSMVLAPTPGPQKGWSGGPATWTDGREVIGVFFAIVSSDEAPDDWFPHATPIRPLTELLRGAGLEVEPLRRPSGAPTPRPPDAGARFQRRMHAIIGAMDDRWDRMESEARALLKLTPDSASARALLAVALEEQGRPRAARVEWDAALRLAPERASLHAGRASTLLALARVDEAVASLLRAESLAPDDTDLLLRLAGAQERAGRRLDAHRALQRAVSYSPNHPIARYGLGRSWSRRGNRAAALRELAQAAELAAVLPHGDDFRMTYAAELARAGRRAEAERQVRALLRRQPDQPQALFALASLLADRGQDEEAQSLAQRLLASDAEPYWRQAAQRLLERLAKRPPAAGRKSR